MLRSAQILISGVCLGSFVYMAGCSDLAVTSARPQAEQSHAADDVAHEGPPPAFYTVHVYDEERDPHTDLAATLARAKAERKRVLIQVGGTWCGWCGRISDFMTHNAKVRELLDEKFLVMKVTYPGKHAEKFLASYSAIDGYPYFFVLDEEGKSVHAQETGALELGDSYDEAKFLEFLSKWVL